MNQYTIFIRQLNRRGTTFITAVEAENIEAAKAVALEDCSLCWQLDFSDEIEVLGVIEGEVNLLEWDGESDWDAI